MQDRRLFSFGPYRLDVSNEQLWRGSELIRLTHKALTVLGYLVAHVQQHGTAEAHLPLFDALGRSCRSPDGAPVIDLLRQHAPTWLMQMPALLSVNALQALPPPRVEGTNQAHMLRELTEALEVLTRERALVLVLEDLLWSDTATVEWLGAVARRQKPAKLFLIGTYRPVEVIVQASTAPSEAGLTPAWAV